MLWGVLEQEEREAKRLKIGVGREKEEVWDYGTWNEMGNGRGVQQLGL